MNPQLQISCFPGDWDSSVLLAVGIPFDGRLLQPRGVTARDLPPAFLESWHAAVQRFLAMDPGGWAASHMIVDRRERTTVPCDPDAPALSEPILCFTVSRSWDDGTTDAPLSLVFDDAAMLDLFDALTSAGFWSSRGISAIQAGYRYFHF